MIKRRWLGDEIGEESMAVHRAIKNALVVCARYARARLNELIVQELETSPALSATTEE